MTSLAVLTAVALSATSASAHLCIIRHGEEVSQGREPGDNFGWAVASGDFNGDGYDDLAMGLPSDDRGINDNEGSIVVALGSRYGITHSGDYRISSTELGLPGDPDLFIGITLVAGNFNGDEYDDLAIGIPYWDYTTSGGGSRDNAGRVIIMRGTPDGLVGGWATRSESDFGLGNQPDPGDLFGWSLAVRDWSGDGYDDIMIGAPGESGGRGRVFWVLGDEAGLSGVRGTFDAAWLGYTSSPGDGFGSSVAVGNIGWGPEHDFIIGGPNAAAFAGGPHAGVVYLVRGAGGSPQTGDSRVFTVGPGEVGAGFGSSLAVGKFFAETPDYEGLAVGEPYRTVGGIRTGRVVVAPCYSGGPMSDFLNYLTRDLIWGQNHTGDQFGAAVASGRFGADDFYDDLAIGAPRDGFGITEAAGSVNIFMGGTGGPGPNGWLGYSQQNLNELLEPWDLLGQSLCFGAFDGTGYQNLAAGAPGEDEYRGLVHVIAPWRQAFSLRCQRSAVLDCDGNLIFSQKPFEVTPAADLARVMAVLLACEYTELDPGDPDY
ncbi:MAG: FG-GAP repeat protein, partial [Candidatus Eisenbacteria bacterium]